MNSNGNTFVTRSSKYSSLKIYLPIYFRMPTREEKENLIIELNNQGKTYREIAHEAHVSFSFIKSIVNKSEWNTEKDEETKALKLFLKGKRPVDVAIKLDLPAEDVIHYYEKFLRLQNLDELVQIYLEIGFQLPLFIKCYKLLKQLKIPSQQIPNLLRYDDELKQLEVLVKNHRKEIQVLATHKMVLKQELLNLQQHITFRRLV